MLNNISSLISCFKYQWEDLRIKIEINFIFRFRRRPIQLVMLVPVGLSVRFSHRQQV